MLGGIDFNPYFCLQLINNNDSKKQRIEKQIINEADE